ncbi:hypothetical protein [Candidatus Dactylopiibacterium carminicum]|nr:hypothetical protein [Candidatus Dactylopiibacterium carminicum]
MCQGHLTTEPRNLHEKFCHATQGIPCRAAHAVRSLLALIVGRSAPARDCCSGEEGHSCGCGSAEKT